MVLGFRVGARVRVRVRFLKMYRGCLASGSAAASAANFSFQATTSACELTRCATGTGRPSDSAERQKMTCEGCGVAR